MALSGDKTVTLILVGVFGVLSEALMIFRLVMRKVRDQRFELGDYFTMFAIVSVMARSALTPVVLVWGNNNIKRPAPPMSEQEIYRRTIGSKLTLANRVIYNNYLWVQKGVVLLLLSRILASLPIAQRIIQVYWVVLVLTIAAVQVTTFIDCRPTYLYWQVEPDPGECISSNIQLITLVALNITTDAMLILLPMPWFLRIKRSWKERFQLMALFSLGLFLIAIAIIRLPSYAGATAQVNRNTWGSIEMFVAAFVANVPTLYTLRRRGPLSGSGSRSYGSYPSYAGRYARRQSGRFTSSNADDPHIMVTDTIHLSYSPGSSQMKKEPMRQSSDESLIHPQ
ncbi:hypothetical protein VTN49DRAFT_5472 [Thermomyces lanuginosus]|uniref:uncharacterized protein n=1 Tax=Thermomyces lanuginosus TaxID=5541 RepID=UPI003742D857